MVSVFCNLPLELQDTIVEQKVALETESYEAFMECFDIKLMTRNYENHDTELLNCRDRLRIHYKPLNKFMIITYKHMMHVDAHRHEPILEPHSIIEELMWNLITFDEECIYGKANDQQLKWGYSISYNMYCTNNSIHDDPSHIISFHEFCEWRRACSQFKKILGNRYEKFASLFAITM